MKNRRSSQNVNNPVVKSQAQLIFAEVRFNICCSCKTSECFNIEQGFVLFAYEFSSAIACWF